MNIMGEIFKAV